MKKKTLGGQPTLFAEADWNLPLPAGEGVPVADGAYDALFALFARSAFRSRFHLTAKDKAYIQTKGWDTIGRHAADFVAQRLAPAVIPNDGKQTPMRGHPVFVAQHATGCCCRGCFSKWHHIPPGRVLTPEEQRYAVGVLMAWIRREAGAPSSS